MEQFLRLELTRHREELILAVSSLLEARDKPAPAADAAQRQESELSQQRQWYREVLDQAIRENQLAGAVLILLCTSIAVVGVCILVYGASTKEPLTALLGALPSAMIWPAVSATRKTRHENIALRTLGLALVSAQSSQQALALVTDFFGSAFVVSTRQAKP